MFVSQNQCNLRLLKYKESSTNIKFDYWKCIGIYEKAHLISDFRKKISPWLGLEPTKIINSCNALFFPSRIRRIIFSKILLLIDSRGSGYDMVDYMDITVIDSPYSLLFTSSVHFYHIQYVNVIFSIGFLCE